MGWKRGFKKLNEGLRKSSPIAATADKLNISPSEMYYEKQEAQEKAEEAKKRRRRMMDDYQSPTVITEAPEMDDTKRRLMLERRLASESKRGRSGTVLSGGSNKIG